MDWRESLWKKLVSKYMWEIIFIPQIFFRFPHSTIKTKLFPSTIYHGVPEVQGDKTRISLAFNSFWVGGIGYSNDETNYLEIKDIY